MNDEFPYMSIFVRDALANMADRDATERGAAWSLMFGIWAAGGTMPFEPRRLARLAGVDAGTWDTVWKTIAADFQVQDGQLRHPLVSSELDRARTLKTGRKLGAEKTNAKRRAQRDAQDALSDALSERLATRSAGRSDGRSEVGIPSPSPSPSGSPSAAPPIPPGDAPGGAQAMIATFCRKHGEKYPDGDRYIVTGADSREVVALLKAQGMDPEAWGELVDAYLADLTPFHVQRRHPLVDLAKNPNEFRGPKRAAEFPGRPSRSERTHEDLTGLLAEATDRKLADLRKAAEKAATPEEIARAREEFEREQGRRAQTAERSAV